MALINIPTDHFKLKKTLSIEKKPLMLKDYLRDDLSSCSSGGFKSFPRRQCCTIMRFLLESDLKKSKGNYASTSTKRLLKSRSRSKPADSTTFSALQRASEAVLNAIKLLPFPSIKSSSPSLRCNSSRKGDSNRRFSRKLFNRSFWRKADKEDHGEIGQLFREFLEEKNQSCDQNNITNTNTIDTSSATMITSRVSRTTSCNSNSWAESEFTADVLQSSSGNSEKSLENGVDDDKTNLLEKKKASNVEGPTVGEDSIKDWPNGGGKGQFSPVSVLDCPFDDEQEDNLARVELEGKKQKLMQKTRRFECLTDQAEPVDLKKRIALAELEDESSLESAKEELYSVSVNNNGSMSDEEDNKQEQDREANEKLLKLMKAKIPLESDSNFKLLLDFFREKLLMAKDNNGKGVVDIGLEVLGLDDIYKAAEDWVNGNPGELVLGWEVQEGRKAYVNEMERNENWRDFGEENEEMRLAVELEVFSALVDELLTDLF